MKNQSSNLKHGSKLKNLSLNLTLLFILILCKLNYAQTTVTFNYTGGMQTFTVPAGVVSVDIECNGAQGGSGAVGGNSNGGAGGNGSKATGTLAVVPGQILNIFVGGAGGTPTGGFNGGGTGGSANAGGGGGASDVRTPGTLASDRKIVGAGGGGGGRGGCEMSSPNGGNGGTGDGNGIKGTDSPDGGGGFPGVGVTGGAAGIGCSGFLGLPGLNSSNENGANGGGGQSCCCFTFGSIPGGGGGGGGNVGGGGGGGGSAGTTSCNGNNKGGGGGGAGGSSSTAGVTNGVVMAGVRTGNGLVKITYQNCTAPTFTSCPSNIVDFAVTGVCGKVITYVVSATGTCLPITITQIDGSGLTSGQIFPVGVTTQTYKATDASGNTATCSFTITIVDNQNPIITGCPSNIVKNTDPGVCNTTATWVAPTASDNCPGVSFTSNFAPGSTFSKGVTTVNYTATDASSNKTTCTFTVTVNDNQLPVINGCPGNIAQNTDVNQCFATVNWVAPTASDNCMISSFTTNKNPGSTFNVGMTTVTYTATDMSGNTKTCSFTVTVTDAQLPTITCPGNATRNAAAGVCKYTVNDGEFNATASDACGISTLLCTLSGATTGSGLATLSGQMLNKGITTALWKATDANGNMNTCMLTIEVKDNELPTITCPPNLTVVTLPGQCSVSGLVLGNPTGVGDNCGMTTVTNNGLTSYPVGMTTVTWKVTDMSGNTATCNQKVTVNAYSCGTPIQVLHYDTTFNAAKVKWVAGKCATAYELRIRKELSPGVWGPWSAWTPASGPGLLHQYTGLDANSFYNYQIRTICGMSTSAAINDWFHTLPVPFNGSIDNRVSNEKESNNVELPTNLVFVPNPANEFTTVLIEGFENHQKTVTMFDLYGKLVFSVKVEAKQNQLELDLQRLNVHTGVFLIRVSDTEKQKTAQLMIERN